MPVGSRWSASQIASQSLLNKSKDYFPALRQALRSSQRPSLPAVGCHLFPRPRLRFEAKMPELGSLAERKKLRQDLHCKSFKWYMTEIIPDLVKYYPPEVLPSGAWGQLRNIQSNKCINPNTRSSGERITVVPCPTEGHALDLQVSKKSYFLW